MVFGIVAQGKITGFLMKSLHGLAVSCFIFAAMAVYATPACVPGSTDCTQQSGQQAGVGNGMPTTTVPSLQSARYPTTTAAAGMSAAAPIPKFSPKRLVLRCPSLSISEKPEDSMVAQADFEYLKPETANDLQLHLCSSARVALPIFGQNLFQNDASPYTPVDAGVVSADYQLGVGDSFALRVWGQLDADLPLTVDRSGNVFIPKVGNVSVAGVQFGQLKQRLTQEIGKVFRNFELAVTMGQLRSVQVFVVGFAAKPGSYSVSSLSTIVGALYAAGGPLQSGSLRNIELRRDGKTISKFDFYDLVLKGDKSRDVLVHAGDVIYIPPIGAQVALYGAVKQPAIYELKSGETLEDMLAWAGGSSTFARDGKVSIERIDSNKTRKIESAELSQAKQFALRGGDVVQLYSLTQRVEGGVTLRGSVAEPLRMPWKEGMRVSDLIPSKDALLSKEFWLGKIQTQKDDAASNSALRAQENQVNWDYALIERLNEKDYSTSLIPFNLALAVNERDPAANVLLQKGDVVHIFNRSDIRVPSQKQSRFVRLEGEIAVPGVYQVQEGETLQQLIERVGGLTQRAYLYGAEFSREAVRVKQQKELERLADYVEEAAQNFATTKAQNAISATDSAAAQIQIEQQKKAAQKLRTLQSSGRVVLGLKPDARKVAELPQLALEDGDRMFVPTRPATVQVIGSVFNRNSAYVYGSDQTVGDYLALSGGATEMGDEKSTFVIRADGSVASAKQKSGWFSGSFTGLAALPGDAIIVPEKVDRTTALKNMLDWSQILANFGLGAAAIKSLGN